MVKNQGLEFGCSYAAPRLSTSYAKPTAARQRSSVAMLPSESATGIAGTSRAPARTARPKASTSVEYSGGAVTTISSGAVAPRRYSTSFESPPSKKRMNGSGTCNQPSLP